MDHDIAWDEFKKQSAERVQKTSVAGKLDTLAAQLNEIQTDTERIAEVVPRILGDENVVDEANLSAEPPAEEAGLGDLLGGGDMAPEADPEQEDAADLGMEGEPVPEEGAGEPDAEPMAEGADLPPEESMGDMQSEPVAPMDEVPPMMGEDTPPAEDDGGMSGGMTDDDEIDLAFEDLINTLQTSIETAEAMGDFDRANALLDMLDRTLDAWNRESGGKEYVEEETDSEETEDTGDDMTASDVEPIPEDEVKKSECIEEDDDVLKASPLEEGSKDDGPDGTDEKPAEDMEDAAEEVSEDAESDPAPETESSEGSEGGDESVPEASKTTDTESDNPIECSETPADSQADEAGENPAAENLLDGPEPGENMEATEVDGGSDEGEVKEEAPSDPIRKSIPSFREMMSTGMFARETSSVVEVLKSEPAGVSEEEYTAICKSSAQGKPLRSLREMMEMANVAKASGGRPEVPDELVSPDDAVNKSVKRIKWGPGVSAEEVMKADWEAYKVYKSQNNL